MTYRYYGNFFTRVGLISTVKSNLGMQNLGDPVQEEHFQIWGWIRG